jgi:serine/threonine protein kinase
MTLAAGTRLGPYEILAPLGAGGMGEVYRARDPRLGRDVAIKVLPAAFNADPERLRRFEQEARAAAALNHPNILTVHEITTHDGQPYVVAELLDGQTLRDALGHGALPVKKAIEYAIQICQGLAAAHEKGIVHRDLKPENVFVTTDGRIKILDFGLAKLTEAAVAGAGATMLATRPAETTPGLVMGTIGYMSPEQVRGQTVDHRTDLFSIGTILYEMLSGQRPFQGDSPADTMSAILQREPPDLSVAAAGRVPPGLERIVQHCLEKESSRRFQAARDLAFDLESLSEIVVQTPRDEDGTRRLRRRSLRLAAATTVGILCGGIAVWLLGRTMGNTAGELPPVLLHLARVAHDVGFSEDPTWSPDGHTFAFSSNRNGNFDVFLARIDQSEVVNVTKNTADNVQPAFSPDGRSIAFVSTRSSTAPLVKIGTTVGFDLRMYGGDVWVMPALGGPARRLAVSGNFPTWQPNGRSVAYVGGQENRRTILQVSVDGGSPQAILPAARSKWEIAERPVDHL